MSHVIVTGYGRSGTSLLYVMLAGTVKGYRFYDTEIDALSVISDEPKVTKRPLDLLRIAEIGEAIPDAVWIVMVRDPRSVLCSNAAFTEDYVMSWDVARTDVGQPYPGLVARDRAIDRLKNPIIIRYEDLVLDPDGVQDALRGLFDMEGAFSDPSNWAVSDVFHALMNGKTRLDTSRLRPWKNHMPRIVEQFEEAPELFDILIKRGYEQDKAWYAAATAATAAAGGQRQDEDRARLLRGHAA